MNPLILFAEPNPFKARSMFDLIRLLLLLNVARKVQEVRITESAFGGHDVAIVRAET